MSKTRPIGEFGKIGSKQGSGAIPGDTPDVQTINTLKVQPGNGRKRQTVYLPGDLAKWLKLHSVEVERDMSEIITGLLQEYRTKVTNAHQPREKKL